MFQGESLDKLVALQDTRSGSQSKRRNLRLSSLQPSAKSSKTLHSSSRTTLTAPRLTLQAYIENGRSMCLFSSSISNGWLVWRYCETVKLKTCWRKAIEEADRAMAMDFLLHLCETYKIQSWGTSWEYMDDRIEWPRSPGARHQLLFVAFDILTT